LAPFSISADVVELIDFVQNRFKSHGYTVVYVESKMKELQMDSLRSEDLKEEKVVTTPLPIVAIVGYPKLRR
jgi:hypothetical protein